MGRYIIGIDSMYTIKAVGLSLRVRDTKRDNMRIVFARANILVVSVKF